MDMAMFHKGSRIPKYKIHTSFNVTISQILLPIMQIQGVLPPEEPAIVKGASIRRHPNCHRLPRPLGCIVLKRDILRNKIFPFNYYTPTPKSACPNHSRLLSVIDAGCSVVPGDDGGFRTESGEGDEVFGFGNVNWLSVETWRDLDYGPHSVMERYGIDGRLDCPVLAPAVGRHTQDSRRRHGFLLEGLEEEKIGDLYVYIYIGRFQLGI